MTQLRQRKLSLAAVSAFYGTMLAIALGASWAMFGELPVRVLPDPMAPPVSAAIGAGVGLALVGASRYSSARFGWAKQLDANFRSVLGEVGQREAAVMALWSGVAEELLFRGFVLRWALPDDSSPGLLAMVLALAASSAAFGILHIGPDRSYLPWTVFATVVGALFGALTLWTGDVTAAVVAHLTVNYFNFLAIGRPD